VKQTAGVRWERTKGTRVLLGKVAQGMVVLAVALLTACGNGNEGSAPTAKLLGSAVISNGVATFSGIRNNYTITKAASGYVVTDITGADGTNVVGNINALKFADVTVNLGIGSKAASISDSDLRSLIELYIAFFNRVPDADGLSYWIDQFNSGMTLTQICEVFYSAAVQYSDLTGYSSTMSSADFVKVIYKNVLGRSGENAPPSGDVAYWAYTLDSGSATKGTVVESMLGSAHTFTNDPTWGWVTRLLDNKVAVGYYFAVQQGLNYNSAADSISKGMSIAAAVTPSSTTDALNLIGLNDSTFGLTFSDIPRSSRTVALVVASDVLSSDSADISALAQAIASERNVTTTIMTSPGTAAETRAALQKIQNLWGVMLIGEVPAPKDSVLGQAYPDDNPYRLPNCAAYDFGADGNTLSVNGEIYLASTKCRNGSWTARIKGRTQQSQLADVIGFIKKDLRLRTQYGNWDKRYEYVQADWQAGIDRPDYTKYWPYDPLYSKDQIKYVTAGTGAERKSEFANCLAAANEFCAAELHGSPDAIDFEGPGIVGETYSSDSVALTASELGQLPIHAKVIHLTSCSTGDFLASSTSVGYLAGNAIFNGDTLLVLASTAVTVVSSSYEQEQIEKKYHLLATGASFADTDTMELTPMQYFGDPTIALRSKVTGAQPKLVIDSARYHGPSMVLPANFADSVGGAKTQKAITLRNEGTADLLVQLAIMPQYLGVNDAMPCPMGQSCGGLGFSLDSPLAVTESGGIDLGNVVFTIKPGSSLTLTYGFAPVTQCTSGGCSATPTYGAYTGRMEIHSNDPELGRVFLEMSGNARSN
jgi:hypothetical protein